MDSTKIEWYDSVWNPITGCNHNCEYCYARKIAQQFTGFEPRCGGERIPPGGGTCPGSIHNTTHGETLHIFERQPMRRLAASGKFGKASYPYGFEPTLHRYKMREYAITRGRTIFVGSMADMFGDWVPDEWIQEGFQACEAAPQHRYIFLTQNPARYLRLAEQGLLPENKNMWFGTTATTDDTPMFASDSHNTFVSIEPILKQFVCEQPNGRLRCRQDWVIIGAETGRRQGKVTPEREWIEGILKVCQAAGVPVFMKNSLAAIWGEPLVREYPW